MTDPLATQETNFEEVIMRARASITIIVIVVTKDELSGAYEQCWHGLIGLVGLFFGWIDTMINVTNGRAHVWIR